MIKIAPSILASDFAKLGEEILKVEKAGADMLHIDVMDGHFVPNITIGPPVVECLRQVTSLLFDVHLMIENADDYIDSFADAGADIITVHVESCRHINRTLEKIKQTGKRASVALNPGTSLSTLDWVLNDVDMVLLMTVNPGFGGQSFIEEMPEKIRQLRKIINSRDLHVDVEVDGGIGIGNIRKVTEAGANVIVAGSAIFKAASAEQAIRELRDRAFAY